jgi:hypothetical protein
VVEKPLSPSPSGRSASLRAGGVEGRGLALYAPCPSAWKDGALRRGCVAGDANSAPEKGGCPDDVLVVVVWQAVLSLCYRCAIAMLFRHSHPPVSGMSQHQSPDAATLVGSAGGRAAGEGECPEIPFSLSPRVVCVCRVCLLLSGAASFLLSLGARIMRIPAHAMFHVAGH